LAGRNAVFGGLVIVDGFVGLVAGFVMKVGVLSTPTAFLLRISLWACKRQLTFSAFNFYEKTLVGSL
jgi:hypothetical protein